MKERIDDFETRREHLKGMTDKELRSYFLELSNKIVDPLLEIAHENTSKSIERSVLLRMGFSSLEAKAIVDILDENNLLKKGAGHSVYILKSNKNISLQKAGDLIQNGDEIGYLLEYFKDNEKNIT